ncbi:putative developmental regulator protein [Erysiphe necator]|uniref:Putative developmental regulator protein n=1 Tax=Uncinula necator TaxID=52586 RepID=A0A0B1P6L0_UNCNE|nr:putative developmental regulator protein [Erysiphe necator]
MPTYLLHGFRWTRMNIRIRIILNDLEDAASEWIMAPATSKSLLDNFYEKYDFLPQYRLPLSPSSQNDNTSSTSISEDKFSNNLNFPHRLRASKSQVSLRNPVGKQEIESLISSNENQVKKLDEVEHKPLPDGSAQTSYMKTSIHFNDWSPIKLVEEYDPREQFFCSQPYAYVADYLVKVDLSLALKEQMLKYETFRAEQCRVDKAEHNLGMPLQISEKEKISTLDSTKTVKEDWFERLRNELENESDIDWYIVYCGDQEREISAWTLGNSNDEVLSAKSPPKTPWSAALKILFKGKHSDSEK